MEEGVLAILWLMILSLGILVTVVYIRRFVNDERKMMIEKGINPQDFVVRTKALWPLRFSLLFIGAGIGLLAGYFLDEAFRMEEVAYFSMLFIFGGAGLGVAYVIEEKRDKKEEKVVG